MAGKIFISYRRDDAKADARSIYQRLSQTFGAERLFMDVDSIQKGRDFRNVLDEHLRKSSVLLAVIGPRWLTSSDSTGKRRLDDPADFVRLEITAALERNIPVIPVLIDDAEMPKSDELPDAIKALCMRQAATITHESFPRDMAGLERDIRAVLSRWMWIKRGVLAATLLFALICGAYLYDSHRSTQQENAWLAQQNREAEDIRLREIERLELEREQIKAERRQEEETAKKRIAELEAEKAAAQKALDVASKQRSQVQAEAEVRAAADVERAAEVRLIAAKAAESARRAEEAARLKRVAEEDERLRAEEVTRNAAAEALKQGEAERALVRGIQVALAEKGYDPGPPDGKLGPSTRSAIEWFQSKEKLEIGTEPTQKLLDAINNSSGLTAAASIASQPRAGCTDFQATLYPDICGVRPTNNESSSPDQADGQTAKTFLVTLIVPPDIGLPPNSLQPFENALRRVLVARGLDLTARHSAGEYVPTGQSTNHLLIRASLDQNLFGGSVSIAANVMTGPLVNLHDEFAVSIDADCRILGDECTISASALEIGANEMAEKVCNHLYHGTCS